MSLFSLSEFDPNENFSLSIAAKLESKIATSASSVAGIDPDYDALVAKSAARNTSSWEASACKDKEDQAAAKAKAEADAAAKAKADAAKAKAQGSAEAKRDGDGDGDGESDSESSNPNPTKVTKTRAALNEINSLTAKVDKKFDGFHSSERTPFSGDDVVKHTEKLIEMQKESIRRRMHTRARAENTSETLFQRFNEPRVSAFSESGHALVNVAGQTVRTDAGSRRAELEESRRKRMASTLGVPVETITKSAGRFKEIDSLVTRARNMSIAPKSNELSTVASMLLDCMKNPDRPVQVSTKAGDDNEHHVTLVAKHVDGHDGVVAVGTSVLQSNGVKSPVETFALIDTKTRCTHTKHTEWTQAMRDAGFGPDDTLCVAEKVLNVVESAVGAL